MQCLQIRVYQKAVECNTKVEPCYCHHEYDSGKIEYQQGDGGTGNVIGEKKDRSK